MKKPSLSIIIPTYNEKKNITILIPRIQKVLKEYTYEILVVDDSSPDGTAKEVLRFHKKDARIKLVLRKKKEGFGAAFKQGYDTAKNDIIISTDADLSFDPIDMKKFLKKIDEGYDVVLGSRYISGGNYEKPNMRIYTKSLMSRWGNRVLTLIFFMKLHDISANFRAIKRSVWRNIKTTERSNALLGEMVVKANKLGYKITEVPVKFHDRKFGDSKISLTKHAPMFFLRTLKYRFTK